MAKMPVKPAKKPAKAISITKLPNILLGEERMAAFRQLGDRLELKLADMARQAIDLYIAMNDKKLEKKGKKTR